MLTQNMGYIFKIHHLHRHDLGAVHAELVYRLLWSTLLANILEYDINFKIFREPIIFLPTVGIDKLFSEAMMVILHKSGVNCKATDKHGWFCA